MEEIMSVTENDMMVYCSLVAKPRHKKQLLATYLVNECVMLNSEIIPRRIMRKSGRLVWGAKTNWTPPYLEPTNYQDRAKRVWQWRFITTKRIITITRRVRRRGFRSQHFDWPNCLKGKISSRPDLWLRAWMYPFCYCGCDSLMRLSGWCGNILLKPAGWL